MELVLPRAEPGASSASAQKAMAIAATTAAAIQNGASRLVASTIRGAVSAPSTVPPMPIP